MLGTDTEISNSKSGGLVQADRTMDIKQILDCIPHRYPFILIDRVHDYKAGEFIQASKVVSSMDPFLQGHFPGNPIMPGVLQVEALAQASAILGKITRGDDSNTCLLTEVTESRFRRAVVPGDVLDLKVTVKKHRKEFFWFLGEATVDGEVASICKFSAKLA